MADNPTCVACPFSASTLVHNWYEERLANEEAPQPGIGDKLLRKSESGISSVVHDRLHVVTRIGRVKQRDTSGTLLLDPRWRLFTSEQADSFRPAPPNERTKAVEAPLINDETILELLHNERRQVPEDGVVPRFKPVDQHGYRSWDTTSGVAYSPPEGTSISEANARGPSESDRPAGVSVQDEARAPHGLKVGCLTGERYIPIDLADGDVSAACLSTAVQRTWLPGPDPGLTFVDQYGGKRDSTPKVDNELSLPLGEGSMEKVSAELAARGDKLYRKTTLITKGRDQRPGISFFKMTTPILLDPLIRDFVLIPIVVVVIMSNIIRMNLMQILGRATPKADPDEVKKQKLFTRAKLLKANGHFLTDKAFQAKKALYLKKDQGLLWQVPPQKNAMDAMMQAQSDPSMATGMMKNQFMFLGIHGTLGYWVSHLFSGFLVAKTPFPLTFKVKSMLQRGVDVPALDTSYVSSLSLYFFVSMSSQGIMQLYQQLR
ncbi:ER membrane complex subunit 3 [Perkinsus olseni]|uniref:ER membrane protein complex subunit 3 n=1 Tax=Perkinsus olseni TaxID=32597 RepID=A0A7J6SVT5_PEROL|nr:ER membrane complex subunit 3 [Perkinsus olseni]